MKTRAITAGIFVASAFFSFANAAPIVFTTADGQFDPGVNNQGWYAPGANHRDNNSNTFTGSIFGNETRSFMTFDLRSFALGSNETVSSVTLSIFTNNVVVAGAASEILAMYDVSSDPASLNENVAFDQQIYDDLGTGDIYGQRSFVESDSDTTIDVTLTGDIFEDIIAAQGDYFSIGFVLLSIEDLNESQFVFGASGNTVHSLLVETSVVPTSVVPLPGAFVFMLTALGGFGAWRRQAAFG